MGVGLQIQEEEREGKKILRIAGKIDASSAPILEKQINSLLESDLKKLLLDFTRVEYLSSAGMRLLLSATKKLKAREGRVVICGMNREVMEIIKMAGFERILHIYPSEQKALEALEV